MGFRRAIVISDRVDRDVIASALAYVKRNWEYVSLPVSNRHYRDRILFGAPELTDYLFEDDTEYELAVSNAYTIADGITKISAEFRGVTFAYVDADCFGGTCLYSGFTTVDGNVISRVEPDRKGHKKLLRKVGLRIWNNFAPFTRNYFSDG